MSELELAERRAHRIYARAQANAVLVIILCSLGIITALVAGSMALAGGERGLARSLALLASLISAVVATFGVRGGMMLRRRWKRLWIHEQSVLAQLKEESNSEGR